MNFSLIRFREMRIRSARLDIKNAFDEVRKRLQSGGGNDESRTQVTCSLLSRENLMTPGSGGQKREVIA